MRIRLAKKGAPSKQTRQLISDFNDWLDNASEADKSRYGKDYSTIEEIRDQAFYERDKRGWAREDCWSKEIL